MSVRIRQSVINATECANVLLDLMFELPSLLLLRQPIAAGGSFTADPAT